MPQTFQEFLQERGKYTTSISKEERDLLYQEHRKLYFKERNNTRKLIYKRVELRYLHEEFAEIENEAKQLGISNAQLLKENIQGFREKRYVRSKDTTLRLVMIALNRWGTGLNSIVYKSNAFNSLDDRDVHELKNLFRQMHARIHRELEYVPLEKLITEEFEKNPRVLDHIEKIVTHLRRQKAC